MDAPAVSPQRVTELLIRWSHGDDAALAELTPLVYEELRRLAHRYMNGQNAPSTHCKRRRWSMRLICAWPIKPIHAGKTARTSSPWPLGRCAKFLVSYARSQRAQKRGGGAFRMELDEAALVSPEESKEIIDLHEALERLATLDSRKAQVVELKYFGGLNYDEIAEVLKISQVTVRRDWEFAKVWLYTRIAQRELNELDS